MTQYVSSAVSAILSAGGQIAGINGQLVQLSEMLKKLIEIIAQLSEGESVTGISESDKQQIAQKFSAREGSGAGSASPKRIGAFAGPAGFLWKPASDSDGNLAVLLPSSLTGKVKGARILSPEGRLIEVGRNFGVGNGGREHFRFSRHGSVYPAGCQVEIQTNNGSVQRITIEKPGVRIEGR